MSRADLLLSVLKDGEPRIPLHARDGSVRAFALVDEDVVDELAELPWHLTHYGYAGSRFNRQPLLMHRVILDLWPGDGRQADHINGDRLDNRLGNLRIVTAAQNRQNQRSTRGTSGFRGVSFHKTSGKWAAQAQINGSYHYLGLHATEDLAAAAVAEFRALNMPFSVESR